MNLEKCSHHIWTVVNSLTLDACRNGFLEIPEVFQFANQELLLSYVQKRFFVGGLFLCQVNFVVWTRCYITFKYNFVIRNKKLSIRPVKGVAAFLIFLELSAILCHLLHFFNFGDGGVFLCCQNPEVYLIPSPTPAPNRARWDASRIIFNCFFMGCLMQ